jgi:hypothetical protein
VTTPDTVSIWLDLYGGEIPAGPIPGVYFLADKGVLQYVGQSYDPPRRVNDHRKSREKGWVRWPFDSVTVIPVPARLLIAVEGAFIRYLKPPRNGWRTANGGRERMAGYGPICDICSLKLVGRPIGVAAHGWLSAQDGDYAVYEEIKDCKTLKYSCEVLTDSKAKASYKAACRWQRITRTTYSKWAAL